MDQTPEKAILTVEEVGKLLRISRGHAYELVHRAGFPAVRLGRVIRVPREALEAWLERQTAGGNGER